ncbi:MAG: flavin reductase [Eubacteriales bacterium]
MYCVKKITPDLSWVGASERRIGLFENVYPVPDGVSYNSYLLMDDKTVLLDTVDKSVAGVFFENIAHVLAGRSLDYLVINHMEPDHAATVEELVFRYPGVRILTNAKAVKMLRQFFRTELADRIEVVDETAKLETGHHTLSFVMMPMVHWPEAMVTYDAADKILFSADAFGSFGALDGHIFADEIGPDEAYIDEMRRYYTNIVGKYGRQVQAILKKAAGLDIALICPLHGYVWRRDLSLLLDKYEKWSSYTPETKGVMIAYASVYGNTENTANILACRLADAGIRVKMYDVSKTHPSYIVADAFRYSHLVFASTTYNAGIFVNMENLLHDIAAHGLSDRTVAFIENGTWAATSGSLMREIIGKLKNMTVLEETVSLKSSLKTEQLEEVNVLAAAIANSILGVPEKTAGEAKIEGNAMFKLSYGLFVLTANDGSRDNGCIINTVMQITDSPKRIAIAVNRANYTRDMLLKSGVFNVSILSQEAEFPLFQRFGFQSGRDADKFAGFSDVSRSENGLLYITAQTNAFLSARVTSTVEMDTHTLFIAEITEAKTLSSVPSVTYQYYFDHIKPKPKPAETQVKGFVCKICGYVYEGETLPPDFVCPLCKHGAEDFEPLQ